MTDKATNATRVSKFVMLFLRFVHMKFPFKNVVLDQIINIRLFDDLVEAKLRKILPAGAGFLCF